MVKIDMQVPDMCHDCRLYCNEDGLSLCMAISKEGKWINDDDVYIRQSWCPLKEIVRCKDCKNGRRITEGFYDCDMVDFTYVHESTWFCTDGERRRNE